MLFPDFELLANNTRSIPRRVTSLASAGNPTTPSRTRDSTMHVHVEDAGRHKDAHRKVRREPAEAALAEHGGSVAAGASRAALFESVRLVQGVRVRLAGDAPLLRGRA